MNILSKIMVATAALFASATAASCKDIIISAQQLPAASQKFIQEFFPGAVIALAKEDRELKKTTYEVLLQDGTEIEFNGKGEWDNVDCKRSAVPARLVPTVISDYVQAHYPGQAIVKIDKERYGHEIELANDLELKFDKNGQLIGIDD